MSLSLAQVGQVAHLARLEVAPAQLEPYARQLSDILRMVDALAQAETAGVTPMAHPLDMVQRLRADAVTDADDRDHLQAIAPQVTDGLYLVPRVLE